MSKRTLTLWFALGITVGLFLTACAGVASGQLGQDDIAPVSIGPVTLLSVNLTAPERQATLTAHGDWGKAVPLPLYSIPERQGKMPLSAAAVSAQTAVQAEVEAQMQSERFCSGDH